MSVRQPYPVNSATGTVTLVSVATANGFSGTVATATTTPAITIIAGAITPMTVNGVTLSGSATPTLAVTGTTTVSGANTGDQTSVSGNAGTATKLAAIKNINGVAFDGSADITVTAAAGTLTGNTIAAGVTGSSLTSFGSSPTLVTPILGTPTSGTLTNCTFPTLNQNTSGSAASLSISGQTGLLTFTGLASTNRIKTITNAADTILELGGSYTPTGTWTSLTLVTPVLGTPASGVLTNCTGLPLGGGGTGGTTAATARTSLGIGYVLRAGQDQDSPADAQTLYFGGLVSRPETGTAASARVYIPRGGNVTKIYIGMQVAGVLGTTETSTMSFRLNNTSDTSISAGIRCDATPAFFSNTALSIAVAAGDYFEIKWVTPTWVTNPTNVRTWVDVYIE